MSLSRNILVEKGKYIYGLILLLTAVVICVAFNKSGSHDFDLARREILIRRIGHELLLKSGDSTSRVLPVKKLAENEYQIRFEKAFTFQTDDLVNITQRVFANDPITGDYVVNVLNGSSKNVFYGYAISKNKKNEIVPCKGRVQPKAPYTIDIKFKPKDMHTALNGYLLGGLPFLAFVGFIFFKSVKPKNPLPDHKDLKAFTLGSTLFDAQQQQLIINKEIINLTGTETRLLLIFSLSPNETIQRSRLQKEIWEDEGVIVGRSLDMFISKLRKKLEPDANVKIVVIRGKGYKLEINSI